MLNKHSYPKAERLIKQMIYPLVTSKTKYSWLVYQQRVCKQQTSQRMYRSPAREELRELYISKKVYCIPMRGGGATNCFCVFIKMGTLPDHFNNKNGNIVNKIVNLII